VKNDSEGQPDVSREESTAREGRSKSAEYLRMRATTCRRLANTTSDATTQAALIGLSAELLAEADRLEK
jgi:hypothetical protein